MPPSSRKYECCGSLIRQAPGSPYSTPTRRQYECPVLSSHSGFQNQYALPICTPTIPSICMPRTPLLKFGPIHFVLFSFVHCFQVSGRILHLFQKEDCCYAIVDREKVRIAYAYCSPEDMASTVSRILCRILLESSRSSNLKKDFMQTIKNKRYSPASRPRLQQ